MTAEARYYLDPTRAMGPTEASALLEAGRSGVFLAGGDRLSLGFLHSALWVQLKRPPADNDFLEVNVATLDRVELFVNKEPFARAGDTLPFQIRPISSRTPVFRLPPATENILLRIENHGPMKFSILLHSEDGLRRDAALDQALLGCYYGLMLAGVLYHLLLFARTVQPVYLYYALYGLAIGFYQFVISGHALWYLFPNMPEVANRLPGIVSNLAFATGLIFTRSFLQTRVLSGPLDRGLLIFALATIVPVILVIAIGPEGVLLQSINVIGLIAILTVLGAGAFAYIRGYPYARFFLLGWSVLLLGSFVQIMANLGLFQATAEHAGQIGSALEMILLALALADRFQTTQQNEMGATIEADAAEIGSFKENRPAFIKLQTEYRLTYQEARICELVRSGEQRQAIAARMRISANTLKKHLANIYDKTISSRKGDVKVPPSEKMQQLLVFLQEIESDHSPRPGQG